MKLLLESWRDFLKEDIYSKDIREFIRFSKKTEKLSSEKRLKMIMQWLQQSSFKPFVESGAFRVLYQSPKGELIKIARTIEAEYRGEIAPPKQNKIEIEIFNKSNVDIFPKVEAYDVKDGLWYIVEKVHIVAAHSNEVWGKLFPKLYGYAKKYNSNPYQLVMGMADFYHSQQSMPPQHHDRSRKLAHHFGKAIRPHLSSLAHDRLGDEEYGKLQKKHKEAVDEFQSYLKNPDENMIRLRNAMFKAKLDPNDFHVNNLGFDDDYNFKIIDIAYGDME